MAQIEREPRISEQAELEVLAVLRTLKMVVAEAGDDFVYHGWCYYVINDQPSCIAAKVLHRLGVPVDQLRMWEGQRVDSMNTARPYKIPVDFSHAALVVLRAAQLYQDQGKPWGDCRDRALLLAYEEYGVTAS